MLNFSHLRIQRDNKVTPTPISQVKRANTFWTRLVGLLNRAELSHTEGLLIEPCSSIHTVGMRFAIDVIYLSKENKVLGVHESVAPYKFRVGPKKAVKVLEVSEGNVNRTGIHLDDILIFD